MPAIREGRKRLLSALGKTAGRGLIASAAALSFSLPILAGNVSHLSLQKIGDRLVADSKTGPIFKPGSIIGPIHTYQLAKNRLTLLGAEAPPGFKEEEFSPRKALLQQYIVDSILPSIDKDLVVKGLRMKAKKPDKVWSNPYWKKGSSVLHYEVNFDTRERPKEPRK